MKRTFIAAAMLFGTALLCPSLNACSAYKVTFGGKTMMGTNYDTWLTDPVIWFETKGFGAYFSGARRTEDGTVAPQTGLNIYGLGYVTLGAPPATYKIPTGKKPITNRTQWLKDILHTCKNVDEVRAYVEQYDRTVLYGEIFMYTDSAGNYLVLEPDTLTQGKQDRYVLANFCPSTIRDFSTIKQQRYMNGTAFLKHKIDSSLGFCTALSDTMHVCREKIGDGTLLTSILDLNHQSVCLYFYHDYHTQVQFKLKEELAKGDHRLRITDLFPTNKEYTAFLGFYTPSTSETARIVLLCSAVFFAVTGLIFLFSFFRRKNQRYRFTRLLLFPLNLLIAFYALILLRNEGIFYFPTPYHDYEFSVLDIMAYTPFLLVVLIIPLFIINRKIIVTAEWNRFARSLFTVNNVCYSAMLVLFAYWKLLNVF